MSKQCIKCGKVLKDSAKFCGKCGTPISQKAHKNMNLNPKVSYERAKEKGKNIYKGTMKSEFASTPIEEYEKVSHPFHQLGGALAVFAYFQLVLIVIMIISGVMSIKVVVESGNLFLIVFMIFSTICSAAVGFLDYKTFSFIKRKNTLFFRNFEVRTLLSAGIVIISTIIICVYANIKLDDYIADNYTKNEINECIGSLIAGVILLAIVAIYCIKSVRVRTYFGSDAYFRQSIFFKTAKAAEPADRAKYNPANEAGKRMSPDGICCPECKEDNPKGTKFCRNCGSALGKQCSSCGVNIEVGVKFCPECGQTTEPQKRNCIKCGIELLADTKFCPECGTNVGG